MNNKDNNKYFLYVRKSTDTEDKQVQSLDDQINIMKIKAKTLGIKIIEVFSESISAKEPGRYRFNEMIGRLQNKEAKGIIAWKLDRLTRNPVDTGTIQFMLQNGTLNKIITSDREYNPLDAGLLFSVETGMSNQFILDLKKSVKRGMDSKTNKGVFAGKAPEGYINNKLEKSIEVDKDRFVLVRKMWDMMISGNYTAPKIMKIANEEWGYKKKNNTKLTYSGINKMFNNPFYTGDFMWKGSIKKGTHKAMISYEEFYRVQELLGEKGLNIRGKTKEFSYTGFMKCGECGSAITAEEKTKILKSNGEKNTYIYYRCSKRKSSEYKCSQKHIRIEDLEKQINDIINNLELIPEFKDWALSVLKDDFKNDVIEKEKILKSLYDTQILTERRINKLTDSLIDEIITKDDYQTRKKHFQIELESIREQIKKLNEEKDNSIELTESLFDFILRAKSSFNHGDLQTKKEILMGFGSNFELKDKKLVFKAYPWFKPIQKISKELNTQKHRFELIKNSTTKGKSSTILCQKSLWYSQGDSNPCFRRERPAS